MYLGRLAVQTPHFQRLRYRPGSSLVYGIVIIPRTTGFCSRVHIGKAFEPDPPLLRASCILYCITD